MLVFFLFEEARITLAGAQLDEERVVEYGAVPYELTHPGSACVESGGRLACGDSAALERLAGDQAPAALTVLTSMFMHGGLLHLAFNMLFLWIFGNNVEDSMGRPRFLAFYLLGGVVALAAQVAIAPNAAVPVVGASGAIAAVLGGYALLYPRARIQTLVLLIFFITLVEVPALVILVLWFVLQLVSGLGDAGIEGGGVAYFAHVGGFVFGLLAIKVFADRPHRDYLLVTR